MENDYNRIWNVYKVTWLFLTQLCGSIPSDPNLVKRMTEVRMRTPKAVPAGAKSINEIQEEIFSTLANPEEQQLSKLIFQRNPNPASNRGLVMRAGTVKAHIKDCARNISNQHVGRIEGERAFSTRVINGVYPDEREKWIPILRPEGDPVLEADGTFDKAVHPIFGGSCLKTFEYVEPARMDFTLKVLKSGADRTDKKGNIIRAKPSVSLEDLETIFMYGGVHGYAGERGDGEGRYTFTIEEVK